MNNSGPQTIQTYKNIYDPKNPNSFHSLMNLITLPMYNEYLFIYYDNDEMRKKNDSGMNTNDSSIRKYNAYNSLDSKRPHSAGIPIAYDSTTNYTSLITKSPLSKLLPFESIIAAYIKILFIIYTFKYRSIIYTIDKDTSYINTNEYPETPIIVKEFITQLLTNINYHYKNCYSYINGFGVDDTITKLKDDLYAFTSKFMIHTNISAINSQDDRVKQQQKEEKKKIILQEKLKLIETIENATGDAKTQAEQQFKKFNDAIQEDERVSTQREQIENALKITEKNKPETTDEKVKTEDRNEAEKKLQEIINKSKNDTFSKSEEKSVRDLLSLLKKKFKTSKDLDKNEIKLYKLIITLHTEIVTIPQVVYNSSMLREGENNTQNNKNIYVNPYETFTVETDMYNGNYIKTQQQLENIQKRNISQFKSSEILESNVKEILTSLFKVGKVIYLGKVSKPYVIQGFKYLQAKLDESDPDFNATTATGATATGATTTGATTTGATATPAEAKGATPVATRSFIERINQQIKQREEEEEKKQLKLKEESQKQIKQREEEAQKQIKQRE